MMKSKEKKTNNLKTLQSKFNKDQQIKIIEITLVIFKISEELYRKKINKKNRAQFLIE